MTNEISEKFIQQLRQDLAERQIERVIKRLEKQRTLLGKLPVTQAHAAVLASYLAQWVDAGFNGAETIKSLIERFPMPERGALRLIEYLHLRAAEGMVAIWQQEEDAAIRHLEFVLRFEDDIEDKVFIAICNFCLGRCYRKKAQYDEAMRYTVTAREVAQRAGYPKMAATARVMESWLLFQKGASQEALRYLDQAESGLASTDDHVSLGNIHSSRGRILRREGRYEQAMECFAKAIEEYRQRDPQHRNVARSLTNLASVKHLIAVQLRHHIDAAAAQRSKSTGQLRSRFEGIRREAFENLDEALRIYHVHSHHRGAGNVHFRRGLMHVAAGDLDLAKADAHVAYKLGQQKHDFILMARARILECMVENAKYDEQLQEHEDPTSHARLAYDFAAEAVEHAKATQNRRVLALALVWQGLTASNDFFNDLETARQCYDHATSLLKSDGNQNQWDDYQALRRRVQRSGRISPSLREWSQGHVGERTFQELEEEFAAIIIPKVWEVEGRKVSRVAKRLSISPKKVRRILAKAGLSTRE